ncbi:MAG: aldehyde ferredoxin oxidoreductase [Desulfurococcales archaeon]|nr:aldehyde ferredoxin oxidoreductase [Desulfurococcales archaeon]
MIEYKVLRVDVSRGEARGPEEKEASGAIEAGLSIHEEAGSWGEPPLSAGNPVFIGMGPLAGGPFFGSHRLVFVFRSPVSMGLHVSTMGGAAYDFARTGLDGLVVEGHSREPALVVVEGGESGVEARVEYFEWREVEEAFRGDPPGARGLHMLVLKRLGESWRRYRHRIMVVGPGALTTRFAGVFSWVSRPDGSPSEVVDSASRGGAGSVLAQGHGVVAIAVGGVGASPRYDRRRALELAERLLGSRYYEAVRATTTKYRFEEKLGTGGTFGVNYVHYRELIPALAFNTIYYSPGVRLALHEKIMKWFWRPFNERVFSPGGSRYWRTCGEPCSVACKKVYGPVKLDYEPAHGMGPMIGVITLEDTVGLVTLVDDLGLDAIEAGHTVAWIFDLVNRGLLEPGEAGLDARPVLDPIALNPEESKANARLARRLLEAIVERRDPLASRIAVEGARRTAQLLDEEYQVRVEKTGWGFRDTLVYAAFGGEGYMTPNYYWSPGMVAPMFLLGRYWTNYSPSFTEPEEYARHAYTRAVHELAIDNAGLCRFHRKWAEKILPGLYKELLSAGYDIYEHSAKLYQRIALYQVRAGAEPRPWESRKTMDLVATIAAELRVPGWENAVGDYERILEWWTRYYEALMELVGSLEVATV